MKKRKIRKPLAFLSATCLVECCWINAGSKKVPLNTNPLPPFPNGSSIRILLNSVINKNPGIEISVDKKKNKKQKKKIGRKIELD